MRRRDLLAGMLASSAGCRVLPLEARAATGAPHLIVVHADGGWDPTFALDPKPGLALGGPWPDMDPEDPDDVEQIESWGEIRALCNDVRRPYVRRFFDHWAHRTTVIPGLWVGTLSHWEGKDRVLAGTGIDGSPDVTAIVGGTLGAGPIGAVDLSGVGRPGPFASAVARAGVRGQLRALLDPTSRFPRADGGGRPQPGLEDADWDAIESWRRARSAGARDPAAERADALWRDRGLLLDALPLGRRNGLADDLELAATLIEAGTCHAVLVSTSSNFDTHADASQQHGSWNELLGGLGILARRLDDRGLLDRTLVLVVSELGRSPERNEDGGTHHWPYTAALLFGADVAGHRSLGGTDDRLVGVACDQGTGRPSASGEPLRYDALIGGVLEAVGIDPAVWLPGVRPLRGFRG